MKRAKAGSRSKGAYGKITDYSDFVNEKFIFRCPIQGNNREGYPAWKAAEIRERLKWTTEQYTDFVRYCKDLAYYVGNYQYAKEFPYRLDNFVGLLVLTPKCPKAGLLALRRHEYNLSMGDTYSYK